ncbi:TPA: hypothetical protein ACN311_001906 [Vibrio parahaemolyticus]
MTAFSCKIASNKFHECKNELVSEKRIIKIVRFIDHFGIDLGCNCGNQHQLKIDHFKEIDGKLVPDPKLKLTCFSYYDKLSKIEDIKLDIEVETDGGFFKKVFVKMYVGLWKLWLNW